MVNKDSMKKLLIAVFCISLLSGCSLMRRNEKLGCKTNGKNVGAERLLSGDKDAAKAARKAKKFKS